MMFADDEWKFCFPEPDDPGSFFFFVPVNAEINIGRQSVQILGHPAVRIKSFGIAQVVDEVCEPVCHFIRVGWRFGLVLFPLFDIFLQEKAFSHFIFLKRYTGLDCRRYIYN